MWGWGPYGGMMGWGGGPWAMGWPMMFFGGIFWIAILALVIAAVVHFFRMSPHAREWERRSSGLDILEERYARGEINREEFLQKKRDMLARRPG
jgi:putative membrane protein